MKVKKIEYAVRRDNVFDFETPSHTYILGNGIVSHNTQEMFSKAVVSGGCFEEGTLVRLADGTNKPINEIVVGDLVITRDGVRDVTHTWDPDTLLEGEPECYELEFEDGHKVVCSDTHPFAVNGQWVQAQDLTVGVECDVI